MSQTVITALCGIVGSAGVFFILRGLVQRPVPLALLLDELDRPRAELNVTEATGTAGLAAGFSSFLSGAGYDFKPLATDLRMLRMSEAQFAFRKFVGVIVGAGLPVVAYGLLLAVGSTAAPWLALLASVVGFVLGFFYPDQAVREAARTARDEFVHALAAYLELVRTLTAGGMYVEGAMWVAASAGQGSAFAELRAAIDQSNTAGEPISVGLNRLGAAAGLPELVQIASSISLAHEQGVSPDDALSSRATILTERQLFEARAEAESATANMAFPSVLLALAFVFYLGVPAVWSLINLTSAA